MPIQKNKRKEKDNPHPKYQKQKSESYKKVCSYMKTTHLHILTRSYVLFVLGFYLRLSNINKASMPLLSYSELNISLTR